MNKMMVGGRQTGVTFSRYVQLIHIAKSQLNMAEESYRSILAHYGSGNTSSKQLTLEQLKAVLEHMVKLGFKPVQKSVKPAQKRLSPATADGPKDERSVIRAIWIEMANDGFIKDGSETALNAWVQRMTAEKNGGMGVAEVQWLSPDVSWQVLESLKRWYRRVMFDALRKGKHQIHPQASYMQVLAKWRRVQEQERHQ